MTPTSRDDLAASFFFSLVCHKSLDSDLDKIPHRVYAERGLRSTCLCWRALLTTGYSRFSQGQDMPAKPMRTKFGVNLLTAKDPLNCFDDQLGFVRKALTRLCIGAMLATISVDSGLAQSALTWSELRDKFEATNPTLIAGRIGIDESRASEITAYLRPNPNVTGTFDQIDPFTTQPPLNGSGGNSYNPFSYALPSGSVDY